jgi:RNA polymerase sigma factor for flagellar operon FliA
MYTEKGTLDLDVTLERYAPMVRRIANQMRGRLPASVMLGDLVQAGMIGLLEAASRFDEDAGAKFETFATQRVRGAMLDELRGKDWLPRSARKAQRDIEKAIGQLQQTLMRPPTEDEIASEMGLSVQAYQKLLNESCGTQLLYLDDLTEKDSQAPFLDQYVQPEPQNLLTMLTDDRFRVALTDAIEKLPEREQLVMGLYYEQEMTLKEIGLVLEVTESRVSQIHSQAVSRLRQGMTSWK